MESVAQGHGRANAESADEVLGFVPVEDEAVHQTHGVAARVEVEPHGEGQPLPPAAAVAPIQPNHGANRALLLDGDRGHEAFEALLRQACALGQLGLVLAQGDQPNVSEELTPVPGGRPDQRGAAARKAPTQSVGDDLHSLVGLPHADGPGRRRGPARVYRQLGGRGARPRPDGVGRPLERAVRPVGERPGLQRNGTAVRSGRGESPIAAVMTLRPRHAPGLALVPHRRSAVEPDDRGGKKAWVWRADLRRCARSPGGGERDRGPGSDELAAVHGLHHSGSWR